MRETRRTTVCVPLYGQSKSAAFPSYCHKDLKLDLCLQNIFQQYKLYADWFLWSQQLFVNEIACADMGQCFWWYTQEIL